MSQNSITFFGTGTSVGIPMVGCPCEVCHSSNLKDKRMRTSALIQYNSQNILIDIGPDFRTQALENNLSKIDAILVTHPHRDHVGGFDDIRALNFLYESQLDLYTNEFTWHSIQKQFYYAFEQSEYTSVPKVRFHSIHNKPFKHENIEIIPIHVWHGKMPCLGFRIGKLAYITDANAIDADELEKLKHLDILVINALRKTHHPSHFTLDEALAIIEQIQPKKAFLTHLSHHMGFHSEVQNELPNNVSIAWDGLKVEF